MSPKIKQEEWIRDKLKQLLDIGSKLHDNEVKNQYAEYTALKLISVSYYKEIFLSVVKKNKKAKEYYDGAVYIDLFAGSGLVELSSNKDIIAGSPLCVLSNNNENFDFAICVEDNEKRKKVLENRLKKIMSPKDFKVIKGDCNKVIDDVILSINERFKNPIVFTFVDPEGMEVKMKTLQRLSDAFPAQDFMINVGSQGVLRVKGKLDKGDMSTEDTWNQFWGEHDAKDLLSEIAQGKKVEKKYQEKLDLMLGKKLGETIPIKGVPGNIEYYILAYSRKTKGEGGYTKALTALKNRIEKEDKKSVKRMLDVITGRNQTLM